MASDLTSKKMSSVKQLGKVVEGISESIKN
jgi:hypothetical protein